MQVEIEAIDAQGGYEAPLHAPLTFSIGSGQSLWLRGSNGSGKSTLLRTIAGRQKLFAGSLEMTEGIRSMYVGDAPAFYDYLTVREHLALFARVEGIARSAYSELIDSFGLAGVRNSLTIELSLGQRKRLALLIAAGSSPDLLLMDEPLNGLDEAGTHLPKRVFESTLQRGGIGIVTSHSGADWMLPDHGVSIELEASYAFI